jgi:hypothetical protein
MYFSFVMWYTIPSSKNCVFSYYKVSSLTPSSRKPSRNVKGG